MKRASLVVCLSLMLLGIALVSCGERRKDRIETDETIRDSERVDIDREDTASATQEEIKRLSFKSEEDMNAIVAEIRRKFGDKPVKMLDIHFYEDGRVILDAQDPENKKNVNRYTFRDGSWENPQPVELQGEGNLEDNLFSLDEIKLTVIPNLTKEAMTRAKDIEGAKIEHVYAETVAERRTAADKVMIYIPVEGTRSKKTLTANGKGTVKGFK